jgi:cell division FtsZ-interacting protein ZapD
MNDIEERALEIKQAILFELDEDYASQRYYLRDLVMRKTGCTQDAFDAVLRSLEHQSWILVTANGITKRLHADRYMQEALSAAAL